MSQAAAKTGGERRATGAMASALVVIDADATPATLADPLPESPLAAPAAGALSSATDEQLAALAQDGSRDAFGEIVVRYHARLRSFLLRRTGGSLADAEDAAQEAFIRAWQRIATYRRGCPLRPWLFTIAAREAAQVAQRESQLTQRARRAAPDRRRRAQESDENAVRLRLTSDTREDFGEAWAIAETLLTADQLGVLWLRYVEGLQPREISQALGKTGVAVRVSLLRSRATIADELARRRALEARRSGATDSRQRPGSEERS